MKRELRRVLMVNRSGAGPVFARARGLVLLVLLVAGAGFLLKRDAAAPPSYTPGLTNTQIQAAFARLPMSFEPNLGQSSSDVKFLARGSGYGLYLTPNAALLSLPRRTSSGLAQSAIEMKFEGASTAPEINGAELLPGRSNYFIGNNSSRWLRNIPQFGRVQYREIYPGINLAFYGKQNRLEYDFSVLPGKDPRQIELNFVGATNLSLGSNGDLVLGLDGGELRFEAPHVYQNTDAGVQTIAGSFVLRGANRAGFEIGSYDRTRTLVIDPILAFSTYLGGSGNESCTAITGAAAGFVPHCPSIAVDSGPSPRIYIAGATTSAATFGGSTPITLNSHESENVFVSRISLSSSAGVLTPSLDYVSYISGSSGTQYPTGLGVDSGFNVYIGGTTNAPDFPTTASGFQTAPVSAGNNHGFVTELDSTGSANLYSTYLSGDGVDTVANMTLDSLGRVYVIGTTTSTNFPTTLGALQPGPNATNQFFFSKINPALNTTNSLQYSTYIGGSTPSNGIVMGGAVAVDANFAVYLAGGTNFTDLGTPNPWILNAFQAASKGGIDVWAAKLNAPANNTQQYSLSYGTYFGGAGDDVAYGIASDGTQTYITGSTTSTDIVPPSTTLTFQATNGGGGDGFVAKFGVPAVTGTTQGTVPLDYFSYLGGSAADAGLGIVTDTLGNARVTGFTDSANLCAGSSITTCSQPQPNSGGGRDAFIARLNTTGTSTSTNTSTASYLGGAGTDMGTGIILDSSLNTYLAGETNSGNFPTANPLTAGGSLAGGTDAFVTELGPNTSGLSMPQVTAAGDSPCDAANPSVNPSPVGVGSPITFTYQIYNTGDPVSGVIFTDTLAPGSGSTTATSSSGSCGSSVTTGTLTCTLGTIPTSVVTTLSTPNSCNSTTSAATAATVKVTVTAPTTVLQGTSSIGNSAALTFAGGSLPTISGSVQLNDYTVNATLAPPSTSSTIPSGGQVNFSINVAPTGAGFPESVTLACGTGLPAGSQCQFSSPQGATISTMSNGPQSRTLAISTTARLTTTAGLLRRGIAFGLWLPFLGIGLVGGNSRKRRMALGLLLALALGMTVFLGGCSSSSTTSSTSGTPAGTYTVPVNATSGSAVRTTTVQFTVE